MNEFDLFEDDEPLDFTLFDVDPEAEDRRFRELVSQCDTRREWDVYLRQSQTAAVGKRDSYLRDQEQIPTALCACGVSPSKIKERRADINKSGALPIAFRADLSEVRDRIDKRVTGTVVCSDIARLFRDRTLKGPTSFASLCELRAVKLLTSIDDRWELLNMADAQHRQVFLQQCMMAAAERLSIKSRMGKSRLRVLRENRLAWSGGPVGVGYAVTQRKRLADASYTRRELFVYEPHASVVKQVLRASVRPEIITWPQLRDYCWDHGIVVPPFAADIRADVGPKSVLYDKGRDDMDAPHKLSEWNIKTIIGNVLLIGDRLYGSGRTAKHTLSVVRAIQEAEGQTLDCKVREHRVPLDGEPVPELAVLCTEDEQDLFWRAARKWLPYDLWAVRRSRYSIHPSQFPANPDQTAGKASAGQSAGGKRKHPWAGVIVCYKHGLDKNGWPLKTHPVQFRVDDCVCYKDHRYGGHDEFCATWGGRRGLAPILTNHLLARISRWLAENHPFLADVVEAREEAQREADRLSQMLAPARKKRDATLRSHTDLTSRMEGMEPEFVEAQLRDNFAAAVRPAMVAVQDLERRLVDAQRAARAASSEATEEELRAKLEGMVAARDLPVEPLRDLIKLFVAEVGVITHDHCTESVVVVRWRDRRTEAQRADGDGLAWLPEAHDVLLCWRNWNRDDRAWTPEDATLKRLWPASSGASYDEIKAALLPGRKWNKLYKRVMELRLTDGSRARQWQLAAQKSERSLAYLNPELGYMLIQAGSGWHDLLDWASDYSEGPDTLWGVACGHNGELLDTPMAGCDPFPLAGGWQLPAKTEECLKMVISSVGYEPKSRPFSDIPHSPGACAARHPGSGPGAYIRSAWLLLLGDVLCLRVVELRAPSARLRWSSSAPLFYMKSDVETMTDADLLAACRKRPWERRMAGAGCGVSLAVGVLAAYAIWRFLGSAGLPLAVIAFFAVGITITVKVSGLADCRSRRHQAELRRRHEPPDFDTEVSQAEAGQEDQPGLDWVLLLHGHGLPHGGTVAIRIELRQTEPPGGHISVHMVSDINFDRDEPLPVERGAGALNAEDCSRLLALLPDFMAHCSETVPDFVFDGFPCLLAAVRRQPRVTFRADCNLAGVFEEFTAHPTPLTVGLMLELAGRVTTQPRVFGWCDPSGNVGVGKA